MKCKLSFYFANMNRGRMGALIPPEHCWNATPPSALSKNTGRRTPDFCARRADAEGLYGHSNNSYKIWYRVEILKRTYMYVLCTTLFDLDDGS